MVGRLNDGGIEFSTYRKSAKVRHVMRHPTASCLVVPRPASDDRRTLLVSGPVSLREHVEASAALTTHSRSAMPGIVVPAQIAATVRDRHDSGKRCVVRIEISEARFGALPPNDTDPT